MLAHTILATAQSASSTYSTSRGVTALAIGALSAWRGYVRAEAVERETGRRPWGWSPTAWSVLCFFSLIIGRLCLRAAADRAAKQPRPQPVQPAAQPLQSMQPLQPMHAPVATGAPAPAPAPTAAPVSYGVTILPGG